MNISDKRAKLVREIMRKKDYYDGIHLKELFDTIKAHPQFEELYSGANKNNKEQYIKSTMALLQHRDPYSKHFQGKHKEFWKFSPGLWTYFENPKAKIDQKTKGKINNEIKEIENIKNISNVEKNAIVKIRVNQGTFRKNLIIEMSNNDKESPIKHVKNEKLLIASHIVDYADCEDANEKADYFNGLILVPDVDKLFDKKYISFSHDNGELIIRDVDIDDMNKMGVYKNIKLPKYLLTQRRKEYLFKRNKKYKFI